MSRCRPCSDRLLLLEQETPNSGCGNLQELAMMAVVAGILLVDFDNSLTDACEQLCGTLQNRTDCTVSVVGNNPPWCGTGS
ncbi:hypothetical protein OPV22_000705 [Ensete ventricosum]|uniref:Uncharacterized protein n=1 Tax=Ensete ventricosum TaxID=4639 RepID=A0AAV8QGW9_ENSVE|nr:hypothetical protein OPV22_000705 [Ensete ventricosum]RWW19246.1 hypothetical protein GW17_00016718 [Ensete ventricosum]RZS11984.1 hypothetical protein BHM03_00043364 [Ensete ventricosum]